MAITWNLGMEIMLVISYMDGDGIKHFRIDQVCEGAASF
jgi:hypothetical protein